MEYVHDICSYVNYDWKNPVCFNWILLRDPFYGRSPNDSSKVHRKWKKIIILCRCCNGRLSPNGTNIFTYLKITSFARDRGCRERAAQYRYCESTSIVKQLFGMQLDRSDTITSRLPQKDQYKVFIHFCRITKWKNRA